MRRKAKITKEGNGLLYPSNSVFSNFFYQGPKTKRDRQLKKKRDGGRLYVWLNWGWYITSTMSFVLSFAQLLLRSNLRKPFSFVFVFREHCFNTKHC